MKIERDIVLEGRVVRLEPLTMEHADALFAVAQNDEVWQYLAFDTPAAVDDIRRFIDIALSNAARGVDLPFVIIHQPDNRVVGSTRYMEIVPHDHALEIGWTWIERDHWRSIVNTEVKYLLLRHAFEVLDANRVQLKTDLRNVRSQQAIARLGAQREGVLREHRIVKGNYRRSSVIFSILDREWPEVKVALEAKMG
ncbi:MAG: GNAT family N-acetyltransferase [Chloroflexota bacterium]